MSPVAFETLAAFALTSLLIELTPGPNMAYLALLSLSRGRRAGFAATAGVALGLALLGIAAALGLAALISSSPALYQVLRWAGVAYMLWLAWEAWHDGGIDEFDGAQSADNGAGYFARGLISNLLNPKAALFYVAVLPAYIDPDQSVIRQSIVLSLIYVLVATLVHGAIVMLAGTARPIIQRAEGSRVMKAVFAALLVGVAVWLAFSTRR